MPYVWSAIDPLPAGITLSSDGVISGVSISPVVRASYRVQVTDGTNTTVASLLIEVLTKGVPAPLYNRRMELEGIVYDLSSSINPPIPLEAIVYDLSAIQVFVADPALFDKSTSSVGIDPTATEFLIRDQSATLSPPAIADLLNRDQSVILSSPAIADFVSRDLST